ncbi:PqiC family protein [Telluria beijingensis]|uniref:PqiC family protein n=1 Tax=Telluria beijingensis TaxID=3068633 RepID=UPI00279532E3|nr:PqiC family protein [Massilia sp. REN29]
MTSSAIPRRLLAAALLASALAACSSTPVDRFYTLSGGPATVVPALATAAPLYFEMRPVTLPGQLRRPQMVVSGGDGRIDLEEHHRWAGPLAEEIGNSLSFGIAAQLGAVDVYRSAAPKGSTLYRIGADVQRFESAPGSYALVDAVWSVRRLDDGEIQTCRSVFQEPVGPGHDALVAGHRAALAKLSATIAAAVRGQAAGAAPACPAA